MVAPRLHRAGSVISDIPEHARHRAAVAILKEGIARDALIDTLARSFPETPPALTKMDEHIGSSRMRTIVSLRPGRTEVSFIVSDGTIPVGCIRFDFDRDFVICLVPENMPRNSQPSRLLGVMSAIHDADRAAREEDAGIAPTPSRPRRPRILRIATLLWCDVFGTIGARRISDTGSFAFRRISWG